VILRTYETREDWLAGRRGTIGSSEAPVLYGLGYKGSSPYAMWLEKTDGWRSEPDAATLKRMSVGSAMEPTLRKLFYNETGIAINTDPPHSFRVSPDLPFMSASLDAFTDDLIPVELKNVGGHNASEWDDGATPLKYQIQLAHQCIVVGASYGYVFALLGGDEPVVRRIDLDPEFAALHIDKCRAFWAFVESRTPPEVDGSDATTAALLARFPKNRGDIAEGTVDVDIATAEIELLEAQIKAYQQQLDMNKNMLRELIGDRDGIMSPSGVTWTWKTQERSGYYVEPGVSRVLRRVGNRKGA